MIQCKGRLAEEMTFDGHCAVLATNVPVRIEIDGSESAGKILGRSSSVIH